MPSSLIKVWIKPEKLYIYFSYTLLSFTNIYFISVLLAVKEWPDKIFVLTSQQESVKICSIDGKVFSKTNKYFSINIKSSVHNSGNLARQDKTGAK